MLDWLAVRLGYPDRHAYAAWHQRGLLYHLFSGGWGLPGLLRVQRLVAPSAGAAGGDARAFLAACAPALTATLVLGQREEDLRTVAQALGTGEPGGGNRSARCARGPGSLRTAPARNMMRVSGSTPCQVGLLVTAHSAELCWMYAVSPVAVRQRPYHRRLQLVCKQPPCAHAEPRELIQSHFEVLMGLVFPRNVTGRAEDRQFVVEKLARGTIAAFLTSEHPAGCPACWPRCGTVLHAQRAELGRPSVLACALAQPSQAHTPP